MPWLTEGPLALFLSSGACSLCVLIFTAAAGSLLKELSLQAENKQNKFSREICAFPKVMFAEWEERNLTQAIWDFGDKLHFAYCCRVWGVLLMLNSPACFLAKC